MDLFNEYESINYVGISEAEKKRDLELLELGKKILADKEKKQSSSKSKNSKNKR